jgi:serine/threonine-protein kinase
MRQPAKPQEIDPLFVAFQLALSGRYSIDREIGRGGMGVVYLAREVHLDRPVAIKLLPPERARDPELRERFLREARLAAKLSHPNIIPIHAADQTGEFVYFVMAYVDGETLAQRVRARGPLSSSEGTRVIRELAWALAYAHSQGLVHRDVKPDNILLERSSGRVLVADFGIAAAAGDTMADGSVAGTPEFMSPEQALGRETDARSDLYGVGATAFFAFTGQLPFEGKTATEILAKHVTEPAPAVGSLGIAVPRGVASLIDRCLAKDPEHRPANAQVLAEQLGVTLELRREIPVALRAFVKRNARLDGGGTLVGLSALLTGSVFAGSAAGATAGFATLIGGAAVMSLGYLSFQARRLLTIGFDRADLNRAFDAEKTQAREELAVEKARRLARTERVLSIVTKTLGALTAVTAVAGFGFLNPMTYVHYLVVTAFAALLPLTVLSSLAQLLVLQRHGDVDTELWSRLWRGSIGTIAFTVAKKILRARPATVAITHRATELSLGLAAEQLYESLPKETQRELANLPAVLVRLQADAQALRRDYDELQNALTDAGAAASSDAYDEIRAARDAMHAKLGDAVSALETIRLNLLRLHAGSATVESLTTHLGLAADVSAEVERLIAARRDVESLMRYPREIAPTPV